MKTLASLGLVAACLLATPAMAGPAGHGLTFTEEVMKKNLQKRAAAKAQATAECAPQKSADKASAESKETTPDTCRAS